MRESSWRLVLLLLAVGASAVARAQSDPPSDDPLFAAADEAPAASGAWYGDFALRGDRVTGFEARDDVERLRGRLRVGWRGVAESWEYAVAAKLGAGTDSNADNRRNLDNERSDAIGLDEAYVRWAPDEDLAITLGKTRLPLALTPLTWDDDLRPAGLGLSRRWAVGDYDALRLSGGYFRGEHLYGDRSRLGAAQLAWQYREGAPFSADVQLAFLHFSRLERAAVEGLTRTNRRTGADLLSDYRLLDLQFGLRWQLGDKPLQARLDLLRNLGADDLRDGARASLVHGDAERIPGWEVGLSWQRVQRDAAMAAFNSDDWWFHSDARGWMPWVAYGFDGGWSLQASLFVERRDGFDETLHRVLLDLRRAF